jgi:uncharacterized protein Smg (DUF494 family)
MEQHSKTLLANIVRIMGLLMRRINNNPSLANRPPDAELVARLLRRGFKVEEIDLAHRWMSSLLEKNPPPAASDVKEPAAPPVKLSPTPRLLHDLEACRLSAEAQGELLKMMLQGAIDLTMVEQVIDFILRTDLRQVNRTRLRIILGHFGFAGTPADLPRVSTRVPIPHYIN